MRGRTLGACLAVASATGVAAFVGGSAVVGQATPAAKASLARVPLQFAQTQSGDGYRGVGGAVAFGRTGVALGPLREQFVGARAVSPVPSRPTGTKVSYFKGTKSQWRTGLAGYSRLAYRNLWPGVDLAFDGTLSRLKYTFSLAPGADPRQVRLGWHGATPKLLADGSLRIGAAHDEAPVAWQMVGGKRVPVAARYTLEANTVGFRLGAYDRSRPVTLDPSLVYAGFIGGLGFDQGNAIAVDSSGAAYVAGYTTSNSTTDGFPATGPDATFGGGSTDGFVAKVKPDGSGFDYVSYIGGTSDDFANGVAVDGAGRAYVVGVTESSEFAGFPAVGGPDLNYNGGASDAFVTVFQPNGTGIYYSTFVGGGSEEVGRAIAVDSAGNAYITGQTNSPTFPNGLSGATFDSTPGGNYDAFVVKIHAGGAGFDYSGFVGGDNPEDGKAIAVDSSGAAYVTGVTTTSDASFGAVGGPSLTNAGADDAFVVKIDPSGSSVVYKGFLGGSSSDTGFGIAVDSTGHAYVVGITFSTNFPFLIGPPGMPALGTWAFISKLDPAGALAYSGYLPVTGYATSVAVDAGGSAYVAGILADPASFPAAGGPDSSYNGNGDGFVLQVRPDPTLPLGYATFVGGSNIDYAFGIAIDPTGAAYVTGVTYPGSPTMPTLVGPDTTFSAGGAEAFVEKIGPSAFPPPSTNAALGNLTISAGTLSPAFASGTTSYDAGPVSVPSVTVTPTAAESHATIRLRLNGGGYFVSPSGTASPPLPLAPGSNTIDVQVTAQDGVTTKTYTITIAQVSSNADLSNLTISDGTLTPVFASGTTSYTDSVPNATASVTVTPTTAEIHATVQVRVNGGSFSPVTSGSPSGPLALNTGPNTIDVLVTAQDTSTTKTYSIVVTRDGPPQPPCGTVITSDCTQNGGTFTKITIKGGRVTLNNVTVGKLSSSNAKSLTFNGIHVTGAATIQFTAGATKICGSTFDAALTLSSNPGAATIGDPPNGCAGNTVRTLTDNASSGPVRVIGNQIGTILTLNGDAKVVVKTNTAGKRIDCLKDAAISGSGNSAPKKTGQCAPL